MKYDLVVKEGLVIDPSQDVEAKRDIAITGNTITKMAKTLDPREAQQTINAKGMIVTPGLIDFHAHVYRHVKYNSVDPDTHCLPKGVTTVVDGGSAGANNFPGFKHYVIDSCLTRIVAFLHVCDVGLTMGGGIGELEDLRHLDFERTVEVARAYSDTIVGIKIRVPYEAVDLYGPQALRLAKEIARTTKLPLMVHPGSLPINLSLPHVLSVLERGDIMTHCYPPPYPPQLPNASIFDDKGKMLSEMLLARTRGVFFDVGHGSNNFCWETAAQALKQQFLPDTISTDLTEPATRTVIHDLPTVLSKFLHLGLPLSTVIKSATMIPAAILGMSDTIGTLRIGAEADIALFEQVHDEVPLWDNIRPVKTQRILTKLLSPRGVIKGGKVIE
ncbi:MAG: amidohydrolase/deacetylase family metallohydrolase [Candidatus Bathyarchaeota archaeon]|nr:amidohydrolase/deacetylase family metallohydrolase [Candidatus Bathyarchaeota archaeon]